MELTVAFFLMVFWGLILLIKKTKPDIAEKRRKKREQYNDIEKSQRGNEYDFLDKVPSTQHIMEIENLPSVIVKNIIDGDTVDVVCNGRRERIRLDAIDCPEDGQEWGNIATMGLIKLIGGRKKVKLERHGVDIYGRTIGTLFVLAPDKQGWLNVNERMVTLGHAWVMPNFCNHLPPQRKRKLLELGTWARSKRIGLWKKDNPVPPWKWRKEYTNCEREVAP